LPNESVLFVLTQNTFTRPASMKPEIVVDDAGALVLPLVAAGRRERDHRRAVVAEDDDAHLAAEPGRDTRSALRGCMRIEPQLGEEIAALADDLVVVDPDVAAACQDVDVRLRLPRRAGLAAVGIAEREVTPGTFSSCSRMPIISSARGWCRSAARRRGR
jgi:hypothetical protein